VKRRLASLLSDAFWLYLLPASAIILPWPLYFRLCRRLTSVRHPYRGAIEAELEFAQTLLPDIDATRFRHEQALIKFVDAADFYLSLTRTHRWFRRNVTVHGDWPDAGRAMTLLGSHWGAGHWIWRDLEHHGIHAWFVARSSSAADFGRGRLANWYGQFRGWGMRRAGCRGVITTGGAMKRIEGVLQRKEAVVVLADLPASDGRPFVPVTFLGRACRLSASLIQLSLDNDVAIAWFAMSVDMNTGRRLLQVEQFAPPMDSGSIASRYAAGIDKLVRERPGSWQIWAIAPEMFRNQGLSN
jgi:hypothetical protein